MLKLILAAALTLSTLPITAFAQDANDETPASEFMLRSSCRAREVERYYCPSFGGSQWSGPYWDRGCSVKCASGQRAICNEASCDQNQNGQPVESSCSCRSK